MMFALCPSVTLRRPCAPTNSSANRTIRRAPVTEIGFTVNPESSRSSRPESRRSTSRSSRASGVPFANSMPWYRSSVFSRITTMSTSGYRIGNPASEREGRTAANRSSACRSSTFTLRNPDPTGVVIGPLIATRESRIRSRTRPGRGVPSRSRTSAPASSIAHSMGTPLASSTRRVASETSGPMPSPGIRVTRCATAEPYRAFGVERSVPQSRDVAAGGSEAVEQDRALHLLDRLRDLDAPGARVRAVEGRPTAEHPGLLRQDLQALLPGLVPRVVDEPVGVHDRRGPDVLLVAPEDRARGRTRGAQDALGRVVEPMTLLGRLEAFVVGLAGVVDQIRQDRAVAGEERLHVDDEVLEHRQAADRLDRHPRGDVANDDLARERVLAVDHHRVRAVDAVRARTPECQRSVVVP